MGVLILGLVLFLGVHSVRIVANDWRTQVIAQRGEGAWKGLYSVLSVVGLVLVVWGYGLARQQPVVLWVPPVATRHIAALLTLVAFILLTAPYVPRNGIKARLHHPMVLGVKVWAFAHLTAPPAPCMRQAPPAPRSSPSSSAPWPGWCSRSGCMCC